jgi:hypothetical protein
MINKELVQKCDLFGENYRIIRQNFKWEYATMCCLSALLYTNVGREVNVDEIKKTKEIIKSNTGLFSAFKETTFFALATLLSLEPNPTELFHKTINIYQKMKEERFHSSPYLTLAAFSIAKQTEDYQVDAVINRAKEFYDAMKKEHRFLTSSDDYGYAAMLATTDLPVAETIREMETCFENLKPKFGSGNALQSLTHVLTIGEEHAIDKSERAKDIYDKLYEKGCKLSKYNELATLGILVLIQTDVETLTDDINEVYNILLKKKGLGKWSMSKHERTMYASALVADEFIHDQKKNALTETLTNNLTSIIIAQQTAIIIAASSASAAAAASSSSN